MQSKILAQKPVFRKNGQNIIDLTAQSLKYKDSAIVIDAVLVDENMAMRPDLISYVAYGIVSNWDLILKFNGISNPFSIDVGQILLIPDLAYMNSQIQNESKLKQAADNVRNQYIDESKKSKIDPKKIIYDQMVKNITNQISKYNLPPNIAEPGRTEITIQDGKIYLGGKD